MMKSVFLIFFLTVSIGLSLSGSSLGVQPLPVNDPTTEMQAMSATEILNFTPSKFKEATGRRMTIKEVVALKAAQKSIKKSLNAEGAEGESKSQLVALLLAIFLGGLGIHRFYLGYPGIGLIQLLTAGGFGIWWIIDVFMIATGSLKPKNGSDYDPTL